MFYYYYLFLGDFASWGTLCESADVRASIRLKQQWYYEHTSIQPMWEDKERLVFQLPTDVALHTRNGRLFEPVSCFGRRPTIYRTGPEYDHSRFPCTRGILTDDPTLRMKCKVTLVRPIENDEIELSETSSGIFIIRTKEPIFHTSHPGTVVLPLHGGLRHVTVLAFQTLGRRFLI